MHLAIEQHSNVYEYLYSTPRKKQLKHQLIYINSGLALAKLGKKEYAVTEGEALWIPFDCLCSLTFMPSTEIQSIQISSRLSLPLPKQAGYVVLTPLQKALFGSVGNTTLSPEHRQSILSLFKHELTSIKPELLESDLTTMFNNHTDTLPADYFAAVKIRDAVKMKQSGKSVEAIVSEKFHNDKQAFDALCLSVLGTEL
ncbi:AraC family ligand binding domain-containing protein [Vibrio sonorensis]|uniref:AraC family ligand binding domain-containing protein n=1 Tax=Vibrio sonorensis TaxID=1004316 RepID=UPI0008D9696D|nr:AraC family ligand binding domain-containing protein [Vibrio sonorensis]